MLQIKDIRKKYQTGDLVQTALDGVSLNLRDNEFVAILGPSGSGKTTLLNVIGGLDRYDSGDLVINGISTKKYTDRDWDSYRNHTVGFIFQSYNLIPHQTVLANVELALTISGISRRERRRRAKKALEDVGLGNQLHKKPNQMSGGQMQRVAIARALVNNPDILLADEPTGALDSDTSVQVMELLKEVSKDRLVVMVTHNPELAEEYANRIVRLRDGKITDDTNPFEISEEEETLPEHKNMGRAAMSVFTALSLSFNNLWTKKARTILTAFAGSIGIIGIALIMSLSTGFQKYIDKIQEDTLSTYPLIIQSETADMTSAMTALGTAMAEGQNAEPGTVREQQMLSQMFAQIGTNDLGAFKAHLEGNMDYIGDTINALKYGYNITPSIYASDTSNEVLQVNPATLFGDITGNSMMSAYMDSNIFSEMINNMELIESQYDVLQGRWPENYTELVMVLSDPNSLSDYTAYTLGLRDQDELNEMVQKVMNGEEVENVSDPMAWSYEDLMSMTFRLVAPSDVYRYNEEYEVWEDMSEDEEYMRKLVEKGEELRIVGIVCPKEGVSASALSAGIAYRPELTDHIIDIAASSKIVSDQLNNTEIDVFTGRRFDEIESASDLDFENMISVDTNMLSSAFNINVSEEFLTSKMQEYMKDLADSAAGSTAPAQADFSKGLSELATDMLSDYVAKNADPATGKAILKLTDANVIVDSYLSGSRATALMSELETKYAMPKDSISQVYRPLLVGLIANYVSSAMPSIPDGPSVPEEPTEPSEPSDSTTAPTEPTEPSEPDDPEEPSEPSEPSDSVTVPTEPSDSTESAEPSEPTGSTTVQTEPTTTTAEQAEEDAAAGSEENEDSDVRKTGFGTSGRNGMFSAGRLISAELPGSDTTMPTIPDIDVEIPGGNISDMFAAPITAEDISTAVAEYMSSAVAEGASAAMALNMSEAALQKQLSAKMTEYSYDMMFSIARMFNVDANKIASAFKFNLTEEELARLMETFAAGEQERSAKSNLSTLGYADRSQPSSIAIYLVDFTAKERFIAFLDKYNADVEASGQEDMVINYTDMTGVLMSSVKTIVDSVSYVLIAFVAVSLIVSSIMIGIITYISVLERTKEIGVLRAIGASKRNISQVFNAETFIIGTCSGLIGVGVTLLLIPVINSIIHSLIGSAEINAQLPIINAIVLIVLSMILTLIGGLIPAKKAATKDPVIALRSE